MAKRQIILMSVGGWRRIMAVGAALLDLDSGIGGGSGGKIKQRVLRICILGDIIKLPHSF